MESKVCSWCHEELPITSFTGNSSTKDGLSHLCKGCRKKQKQQYAQKIKEHSVKYYKEHTKEIKEYAKQYTANNKEKLSKLYRKRDLNRKYGITPEKYEELLKNQDNRCAICGKQEERKDPRTGKTTLLSVDHDHSKKPDDNNFVRGLLCTNCNHLLGNCKDNIQILKEAIRYLLSKISN